MTSNDGKTLHIFTFKEGLLSKVAHDLRLSVQDFSLEVEEGRVELVVPVRELRVDGAMKRGELRPKTLSEKDKRDILDNMHKDVLRSGIYPEIRFVGEAAGDDVAGEGPSFALKGELEMGGRKLPLRATVERRDGRLRSRIELVPSRWGIKPFSAMLGTLKVKDRVEVELEISAP